MAVDALKAEGVSERTSCSLVGVARSGFRKKPKTADDTRLAESLRDYSRRHSREGYRKAAKYAATKLGEPVNHKRAYRVWRREGLIVPRKSRKRRRGKGLPHLPGAVRPNHVWAMDFVSDSSTEGRALRFFAVADEFTRESLCIIVARSFRAVDVKAALETLFMEHGTPLFIRCDNGPEFVAKVVKDWLDGQSVNTSYIEPGKPWQNGTCESFNGRFREECLDMEVFFGVRDAQATVDGWRRHYNETRPHGSLGYRSPVAFKREWQEEARRGAAPVPRDFSHGNPKQVETKKDVSVEGTRPPASEPATALRSRPRGALSSVQAQEGY